VRLTMHKRAVKFLLLFAVPFGENGRGSKVVRAAINMAHFVRL